MGSPVRGHAARQLTQRDYDAFDLLIGMDQENLWNIRRICGGDPRENPPPAGLHEPPGSVADPWYTGDFETTWRDVDGAAARCWGAYRQRSKTHDQTGNL